MGAANDYAFQLNISVYLSTPKRTTDLLHFLAQLYNRQITSQKHLKLLQKKLKQNKSPIKSLKILTMLNMLLRTEKSIEPYDLIEVLKSVSSIQLMKLGKKVPESLKSLLNVDIIPHYVNYLLKRSAFLKNKRERSQQQSIVEGQSNILDKCFDLMNLLNSGLCFHNKLFVLGRYYTPANWFLIDFNIVLCIQFKELYEQLKNNFEKLGLEQSCHFEIVEEIEAIHEKMNSVFLNTYHYSYLQSYTPQRIQTDKINNLSTTRSSTHKSSFSKTLQFSHSTKQKSLQEYELLLEMENIICKQFDVEQSVPSYQSIIVQAENDKQNNLSIIKEKDTQIFNYQRQGIDDVTEFCLEG